MGKVYVVDVWPGQTQDLTLRAARVLREAGLVVAGDASGVSALLNECGISTAMLPLDQSDALATILDALERGDVAWASEGVTTWKPWERCLAETLLSRGVELVSIPGPTAAVVALVTSGLPADRFAFLGPLPAGSSERRAALYGVAGETHTLVYSVQAAQLCEALSDLSDVLGDRQVAICCGQETWRGTLSQARPEPSSGPITLVVEGAEEVNTWTEDQICRALGAMLQQGSSVRDAARAVAVRSGWPRREVYRMALRVYETG